MTYSVFGFAAVNPCTGDACTFTYKSGSFDPTQGQLMAAEYNSGNNTVSLTCQKTDGNESLKGSTVNVAYTYGNYEGTIGVTTSSNDRSQSICYNLDSNVPAQSFMITGLTPSGDIDEGVSIYCVAQYGVSNVPCAK